MSNVIAVSSLKCWVLNIVWLITMFIYGEIIWCLSSSDFTSRFWIGMSYAIEYESLLLAYSPTLACQY
jgi:hypothetical protein